MSRARERRTLRIPRRLVCTALHVAVAGTLGCGDAARPTSDAAVSARDAAADLRAPSSDACGLVVSCVPVVAGADCSGRFCGLQDCPNGCEPYV